MPLEATKAALVRMLQLLADPQGEDANSMRDDVEHSTDQSSALPAASSASAASSHNSVPFAFPEITVQPRDASAPGHECFSTCCSKETINASQSLPLPHSNATPRGILLPDPLKPAQRAAESSAMAAAAAHNSAPSDDKFADVDMHMKQFEM